MYQLFLAFALVFEFASVSNGLLPKIVVKSSLKITSFSSNLSANFIKLALFFFSISQARLYSLSIIDEISSSILVVLILKLSFSFTKYPIS